MVTTLYKYNKILLGNGEVSPSSLYSGDDQVNILHHPDSIFRKSGEYEVGDAVLWDNERNLFKVIPTNRLDLIPDLSRYTPTGVVAIPSSHDVYGTGEAGVAALKSASLTTPDIGSDTAEKMYYGGNGVDLAELPSYDKVYMVGLASGDIGNYPVVNNIIEEVSNMANLPSDRWDAWYGGAVAVDGTQYNAASDSQWMWWSASPFLLDGSRNLVYSQEINNIPTYNFTTRWEVRSGNWNESSNTNAIGSKQYVAQSPGANGSTVIRCYFSGCVGEIIFWCRYQGESNFDYLTIGDIDTECTRTKYKKSLRSHPGRTFHIKYNTTDTDEHFVEFCYSKDSSTDTAPDNATVYALKQIHEMPNNALSDFNGKYSTEVLCSESISQPEWKTADTLVNNYGKGYYPAACACWRYHTVGTSQGDWYLPACGELGYCHCRYAKIEETMSKLTEKFGIATCLWSSEGFWSSSEISKTAARDIAFNSGLVYPCGKGQNKRVIPFTRLK